MEELINQTSQPNEYFYFDKLQDQNISYTPIDSEIVVSLFPEDSDVESYPMNKFTSICSENNFNNVEKINKDIGVAVFERDESENQTSLTEIMEISESISNSIPALRDNEGNIRYFVPNELTVQFNEDLSQSSIETILNDIESRILISQRTPGYFTISVPDNKSLFETINILNKMDEVIFSEPSEIGFGDHLNISPKDFDFKKLWGLKNIGQTIRGKAGKHGVDIDLLNAWKITQGDNSVINVVIDTGMDLHHPDLSSNLLPRKGENWDFADNDGSPDDSGSHGTHVCGTIGAISHNSIGIVGIAPHCKLMPLRINLRAGRNQNRADAINYVTSQAVKNPNNRYVVNCSWRASGNFGAIGYAIKKAVQNNVLIIFAAGNDNRNLDRIPQYPASYKEVIAVAALNSTNKKATFSNYGTIVDISASGVDIWSTVPLSSYNYKNGTSMAAPHVAGVAALIWSANKSLSANQVREILESTCSDVAIDNPSYKNQLGKGRVNAYQAVLKA